LHAIGGADYDEINPQQLVEYCVQGADMGAFASYESDVFKRLA
jgi:hypothetical protein